MSQKQHRKQVARARARRQEAAVSARQRRTRVIAVVLIAALALSVFAVALLAGGDAEPVIADAPAEAPTDAPAVEPCPTDVEAPEPAAEPYDAPPEMAIDESATYVATIETTCGSIVLELAAAQAPATVNNFVTLARDDYYVGVPFHRVMDDFMIQGGDPTGTGHGGQGSFPGYTFPDELALAEQVVAEQGAYPRGTLAMANSGPDSNGSQFFIVQADPGYPLPAQYAVFGRVIDGMDVVDRIALGPTTGPQGDQAVDPVRILDVTIDEQAG